jgi:uncharacterized protein (TIGR02284 family)
MAQDLGKLVEKLDDLIALDIDAVNAYQAAIDRITVPVLQEKLREFQGDHRRHIRELSDCVVRYGGTPRQTADFKGFFLKGFTAVTSMMGNEAALRAMRTNEQLTNRTYQKALQEAWPADVRVLIEKNFADEQRHLAYIQDALNTRFWEAAEQPPR